MYDNVAINKVTKTHKRAFPFLDKCRFPSDDNWVSDLCSNSRRTNKSQAASMTANNTKQLILFIV